MSHIDYNEDNPGPGTYYLNYKHILQRAPDHSFGLRTGIWFDYNKPGPGTYNVRKDGNDSPKHTMGKYYEGLQKYSTPGPGAYFANLNHTNIRVPAYSMQGKYNYFPDPGYPGPGTYNLREEIREGKGYSMGKKSIPTPSTSPGPGTFSPKNPSSAPAYNMCQHLFESRPNSPGPSTYAPRSAEFSGPKYTFGRRFYRLKDQKERRWSKALKQRPNYRHGLQGRPTTNYRGKNQALLYSTLQPKKPVVRFSQAFTLKQSLALQEEVFQKHVLHIHHKPEVTKRHHKNATRCDPGTERPTYLTPPPQSQVEEEPKANGWMDVAKKLQYIRDRISISAQADKEHTEQTTELPTF